MTANIDTAGVVRNESNAALFEIETPLLIARSLLAAAMAAIDTATPCDCGGSVNLDSEVHDGVMFALREVKMRIEDIEGTIAEGIADAAADEDGGARTKAPFTGIAAWAARHAAEHRAAALASASETAAAHGQAATWFDAYEASFLMVGRLTDDLPALVCQRTGAPAVEVQSAA